MSKSTSALFCAAAAYLRLHTGPTGSHPDLETAITAAGEAGKYLPRTVIRACQVAEFHFGVDDGAARTRKNPNAFGKRMSKSRNEHAINSVLGNRDRRNLALLHLSALTMAHHSRWFAV